MKKLFAILLMLMLGISTFAGMGIAEKPTLSVDHLTVTYVSSPLNVPSIVEKEKGIFAEVLGVPVEYAEITSGADQTQALASGDVQILYAVGGTSIILSAANGADIKLLDMYSRSPKAFCLYASDEAITTPEALAGKTVAGPAGTNLHQLLVAYLATAGMTIDDVDYVNMSISDAKAALDGGSIDVAMLAGANAYNAGLQGHHLVTDGEGLISASIVVAVTEEFYEAHPDVIERFQQAEREIADYMFHHEEEALNVTAEYLDLDLEAVQEMYAYYDFSLELTETDISGLQETADFMYESGMIEEPYDVEQLFF